MGLCIDPSRCRVRRDTPGMCTCSDAWRDRWSSRQHGRCKDCGSPAWSVRAPAGAHCGTVVSTAEAALSGGVLRAGGAARLQDGGGAAHLASAAVRGRARCGRGSHRVASGRRRAVAARRCDTAWGGAVSAAGSVVRPCRRPFRDGPRTGGHHNGRPSARHQRGPHPSRPRCCRRRPDPRVRPGGRVARRPHDGASAPTAGGRALAQGTAGSGAPPTCSRSQDRRRPQRERARDALPPVAAEVQVGGAGAPARGACGRKAPRSSRLRLSPGTTADRARRLVGTRHETGVPRGPAPAERTGAGGVDPSALHVGRHRRQSRRSDRRRSRALAASRKQRDRRPSGCDR